MPRNSTKAPKIPAYQYLVLHIPSNFNVFTSDVDIPAYIVGKFNHYPNEFNFESKCRAYAARTYKVDADGEYILVKVKIHAKRALIIDANNRSRLRKKELELQRQIALSQRRDKEDCI